MMTPEEEALAMSKLPPEITGRLRVMIRRVRRIIFLRGLLTSVAVLLGCSLAIMAIDAGVMIFSSGLRWALSLTGLVFVLATAWSSLVRPLMQPLSLTLMARVLETRHPELQERISSALELLAMGGGAAAAGSEQLIQLLARDAQADISGVQARHEFTGRSLKPALVSAGVIVGIFVLLFVVWPKQTSLLFTRAVAPYANLAGLQGAGLEVEPGDVIRLEGTALGIRLSAKDRPRARAVVHMEMSSGDKTIERMLKVSSEGDKIAQYELNIPMVTDSFRYRIRYGTGLTRFYEATVLPPPSVRHMVVTCQYPEYTQLPDHVFPEEKRDIVGLAGSTVTIEANFNREAEGGLLLGDQRMEGTPTKQPGASWRFVLSTNMPERWALSLRDVHGFSNRVDWAGLSVVPDRAPRITLQNPNLPKLSVPPFGFLAFGALINEDIGLARQELVLESLGDTQPLQRRIPLALTKLGAEEWAVRGDVDLSKLELAGAVQFKAWVSVTDTLPAGMGGPHQVDSRVVEITIDENAKSIVTQERELIFGDIIGLLTSAATLLGQAADAVAGVQSQTAQDPLPAAVSAALAGADRDTGASIKLMIEAIRIAKVSRFAPLVPRIVAVGKDVVSPAWDKTKGIPAALAAQRPGESLAAVEALRIAQKAVMGLIDAAKELNKSLAEMDGIHDLTERERKLANQARHEMTPEEMDEWIKQQKKLLEEINKTGLLGETKLRNKVEDSINNMQDAKDQKPPDSSNKNEKNQKNETEAPKGKDSKGKGGKGGKENVPDDDKKSSPKSSSKMSKGQGKGKGAAGGNEGKKGKPGASRESQAKASNEADTAVEIMSTYQAKKGMGKKGGKKGKGGGKGGSGLMPGGGFVYIPGTFDGGISDADWARINGTSDDGASTEKLQNIPEEYRGLVRSYFIELAREGAKSRNELKTEN